MSRRHELLYGLNSGGVDPEAVARIDLEKMRLAGEHPVAGLLPRVLGPATLFPGSESLTRIPSDAQTRQVRFLRNIGTSYILLMSASEIRISLDGVIQQVPAVSTAISASSWTDASTSPATARTPGRPIGLLLALTYPGIILSATTTASARIRQTVSVAGGDQSVTHILRVVVGRGPVFLRVGTTSGGQELIEDVELDTGTHKVSFVPGTATIYVEIRADDPVERIIDTVQFESTLIGGTGDLVLPTPWASISEVEDIRVWQSIDVLFCGDGTRQQRRIEHRGPLSWGIALYKSNTGPFLASISRVTLTPSALSGNVTLTASENFFVSGHAGALIEVTQAGKTVTSTFDAADQTSDYVTVVGIGAGRFIYRTGSSSAFVGTVILERSFDAGEPLVWTTTGLSYVDGATAFARTLYDDNLNNMTVHYRWRVTAYTSGSCTMTLEYDAGVQVGRARITEFVSTTEVRAEVIRNFGGTTASRNHRIGDWSDARGWPRTPVIHDSRLHWFREDTDFASVPDDYTDYDDETEGDSAPFTRSVGSGGESGVLWALSQDKLIAGTATFEAVIAASELDEPLTPTRYTVRKPSRRGCADVEAVEHDDGAFFVQRSARRLYEISIPDGSSRFSSQDVSRLNPAAYRAGIVRIAVQQQPDTRVYAVLEDGTLAVMTFERDDKVVAVTTRTVSGGLVEDICVLPNTDQDDVYLIVNRSGQRYHERFAAEFDQTDPDTCALLDAHKVLTGSVSQITGATHLAGQTVQVWADGQRRDDVVLNGSGVGALGATYARVVYGLRHYATFKSVKLNYAAGLGTAIGQTKQVKGIGLVLANSCLDGISVGPDASTLDPLPDVVSGAERTASQFFDHYDHDLFPINSAWDADARFYVKIDSAEGPVTMQAVVVDVETRDGAQER